MICIIAYTEKRVPTVIESSISSIRTQNTGWMREELRSKDEEGKNVYLPGKYSIELVELKPDGENVIKTVLHKKLETIIVKSYTNDK